jgi:membrane protease YdiL (CAAX protease family)
MPPAPGGTASRVTPGSLDVWLPVGLLLVADASAVAGLVPWTRVAVAAMLIVGFTVRVARDREFAWAWGAAVPLALRHAWATIPPPGALPGLAACDDLLSPPAIWRVAEAGVLLCVLGVVAMVLRADGVGLGLRAPARPIVALAVLGPLVAAPLALVLGPPLAHPFFGPFELDTGLPGALVPALTLGLANGTLEEVLYRGALMGWTARLAGPTAALGIQALAFGLGHGGPDFVGSPLPVVGTLVVAGIVAGLVVQRTGSLLLPIAIHAAVDIPLYYYQACRLS